MKTTELAKLLRKKAQQKKKKIKSVTTKAKLKSTQSQELTHPPSIAQEEQTKTDDKATEAVEKEIAKKASENDDKEIVEKSTEKSVVAKEILPEQGMKETQQQRLAEKVRYFILPFSSAVNLFIVIVNLIICECEAYCM